MEGGYGRGEDSGPLWGQVTMSRTHISCHSSVYFLTTLYFAFIASLLTRALRYCYCNCCCSTPPPIVVVHVQVVVVVHVVVVVVMLQLPAGNRSLSRQRSCMLRGCEEENKELAGE